MKLHFPSTLMAVIALLSLSFSDGFAADRKQPRPTDKGRQRILSTEGRSKRGEKTNIDFEAADIDGRRRTPAGVAISKKSANQDYDLINLRLRWHPEMVQSTSNLETGRGR